MSIASRGEMRPTRWSCHWTPLTAAWEDYNTWQGQDKKTFQDFGRAALMMFIAWFITWMASR